MKRHVSALTVGHLQGDFFSVFMHNMNTRHWISDSRTYFFWRKIET